MKKLFILILFVFKMLFVFAQSVAIEDNDFNKSGAIKLTFVTTKEEAVQLAKIDIKKGIPFILIKSGIAPVAYSTDSIFENKFKVFYHEQGCLSPDYELMKEYNFVIFDFLTNMYGKKWRRMIRKDAVGFRQWKRKV